MAALIEGQVFIFDPTRVPAGRDYVRRCLRGHLPFAVLTGSVESREPLIARITVDCAAVENLHTVRVATPTHSVQVFLSTCLSQLELELADAELDDLHDLMVIFLRHESARGRRTVVILEKAEHFGLNVFRLMRELAQVRAGTTPGITFVLTGSSELHRILDCDDMSGLRALTRRRFDVDSGRVSRASNRTIVRRPID